MKRTFITGILSSSLVAACLVARASAQVYSQNCCGYPYEKYSITWQKGPIAISEYDYWTDPSGNLLTHAPTTDDPLRSRTWFSFGNYAFTVPLSARQIVSGGTTVLLSLGAILTGLLAKKFSKSAVR